MKKLIIIGLFFSTLQAVNAQPDIPKVNISNGLINALLYLPDPVNGYYRATRFDWSGIIARLEFEGHNYYGQWFEKYNPETHDAVMGPVEEFGPVGFDEVKTGSTFLKIGVGLLTRPDEKPYSNFRLYQINNSGTWKINKYSDGIKYIHTITDPKYGYVYEKRIQLTVGKPELVISHIFRNKGNVLVETTVYNHNFPVIDKQPAGPGYVITFPFNLSGSGLGFGEVIGIQDNKLVYLRDQLKSDRVYFGDLKGYSNNFTDYDIRIENHLAGAGIRIRCDQPLNKLVYWSSPTTVCPEPYIRVTVKPGEEFSWELKYEYYILKTDAKK